MSLCSCGERLNVKKHRIVCDSIAGWDECQSVFYNLSFTFDAYLIKKFNRFISAEIKLHKILLLLLLKTELMIRILEMSFISMFEISFISILEMSFISILEISFISISEISFFGS